MLNRLRVALTEVFQLGDENAGVMPQDGVSLASAALIENLWRIAFADGELHHYEEHVIRRIAGLIHVSHMDFIAAKLRAEPPR